jgi:phage shock protein C
MNKRIMRSRKDAMLGGICAGIADYLDVDPTLVRLGVVLLTLLWGTGIWLYLIAWVIIPQEQ